MRQKITHLKWCTASINKAPTSFYMGSTIRHLTVPLTRQICYCQYDGKTSMDFIVLHKDYTTCNAKHFGKSHHRQMITCRSIIVIIINLNTTHLLQMPLMHPTCFGYASPSLEV